MRHMCQLAFLLGCTMLLPRAHAATITATTCSRQDVQAAIDAASDSDTVAVPAGTCSWNAGVSIIGTAIILQGAGADAGGTKITYAGTNHELVNLDAQDNTGHAEITGFWFQGGDSDYWNGTAIQFWGPAGWKNLRIHHNTFDGNTQWTIKGGSSTHGLIDHNTFKGTACGIMLYGNGATDWATPLILGTADFFFIEDNVFEFNDDYGNTKHPAMDMDSGGRQVFRHNTLVNGFWETHDKARSSLVSANAYEIYANDFTNTTTQWKGLDVSAGTGVIYDNAFAGEYSFAIGAMDYKSFDPRSIALCDGTDPADQNTPGESGWRCQYQIGSMGEGPTAVGYPLYLWGNTMNGAPVGMACSAGCNHVQEGRDFINSPDPKAGYQPFTYPHPLAGGVAPDGGAATDAGKLDAPTDGPQPPDGSVPDGGSAPDTGPERDAGQAPDAGSERDAAGNGAKQLQAGCGCRASATTPGCAVLVVTLLAGLAWAARRRSR